MPNKHEVPTDLTPAANQHLNNSLSLTQAEELLLRELDRVRSQLKDQTDERSTKPQESGSAPAARYLTKSEVAEMFSVTSRTVELWMRRGLIPFVKIGRTVRFRMQDINAHLVTINARN
jgi:excisionase family DNA binding protein